MVRSVDKKLFLILLIMMIVLTALSIFTMNIRYISAEIDTLNMMSLFEKLNHQIANDQDFFIAIQFVTPLVGGEEVWLIPYRGEAPEDISVYINEIGDDYICFDSIRGSARYLECTPYSNIAGVWHLIE